MNIIMSRSDMALESGCGNIVAGSPEGSRILIVTTACTKRTINVKTGIHSENGVNIHAHTSAAV